MQLICAAVIEELQPLLGSGTFKQESEKLFKHHSRPILIAALGVGLVDFASGFQTVLHNFEIDKALLTGTCGVYPEALVKYPLGTLVVPEKVSIGDLSEVERSGYFPPPVISSCNLDVELFLNLLPVSGGYCLTLATITADDQSAIRLANHYRVQFEQMEAYAFARICQLNRVTGTALFAVANQVGSVGHAQWRVNSGQCAVTVADLIRRRFTLA